MRPRPAELTAAFVFAVGSALPRAAVGQLKPVDLTGQWMVAPGGTANLVHLGNNVTMTLANGFVFTGHLDTYNKLTLRHTHRSAPEIPGDLPPQVKQQLIGSQIKIIGRLTPRGEVEAEWIFDAVEYDPASYRITARREVRTPVRLARNARSGKFEVAVAVTDWRGFMREGLRGESYGTGPPPWHVSVENRLLIVSAPKLGANERVFVGEGGDRNFLYRVLDTWSEGRPSGGTRFQSVRASLFKTHLATDELWDSGWTKVAELTRRPIEESKASSDAALILAYVAPNVLPGTRPIQYGGHTGRWRLDRGGNQLEVRFARKSTGGQLEPAGQVFDSDTIYIEVMASYPEPDGLLLPGEQGRIHFSPTFDAVEVLVGRDGAPQLIDGKQTVVCRREEDSPLLFRSGPILLVHPSATSSIPGSLGVRRGDSLHAMVADSTIGPRVPPMVSVRIAGSLDAKYLWADAIRRAAHAYRVNQYSGSNFSNAVVDAATNYVITNLLFGEGPALTTEIQLGHVAAMILLRDRFVSLMEAYLRELSRIRDTREILGFSRLVGPGVEKGTNPIALIDITGADSSPTAYGTAMSEPYLRAHFKSRAAAQVFVVDATRDVITNYIGIVTSSIQKARRALDGDGTGLLELTSAGFGPVVTDLIPDLLRPTASGNGARAWEADVIARARVRGIEALGEQLRAQEKLSQIDTQVLTSVIAIATLVSPAHLIRTLVSLAQGAWDVGSAANSWVSEGREKDFAKGAATVIGRERLDMAESEASPWWAHLISALGAGVGLSGDVLDAVARVNLTAARARLPVLLGKATESGPEGFAQLPEHDQADLLALMESARRKVELDPNAPLTPTERQLLSLSAGLTEHVASQVSKAGRVTEVAPGAAVARPADAPAPNAPRPDIRPRPAVARPAKTPSPNPPKPAAPSAMWATLDDMMQVRVQATANLLERMGIVRSDVEINASIQVLRGLSVQESATILARFYGVPPARVIREAGVNASQMARTFDDYARYRGVTDGAVRARYIRSYLDDLTPPDADAIVNRPGPQGAREPDFRDLPTQASQSAPGPFTPRPPDFQDLKTQVSDGAKGSSKQRPPAAPAATSGVIPVGTATEMQARIGATKQMLERMGVIGQLDELAINAQIQLVNRRSVKESAIILARYYDVAPDRLMREAGVSASEVARVLDEYARFRGVADMAGRARFVRNYLGDLTPSDIEVILKRPALPTMPERDHPDFSNEMRGSTSVSIRDSGTAPTLTLM